MSYAETTTVPISRSIDEIKRTAQRFGGTQFAYFENGDELQVAFVVGGYRVLMRVRLPERTEFETTPSGRRRRKDAASERAWEQACRARVRALAACVKAKFVAVDDAIETFEEAFMPHVVTPDGKTVGQQFLPQIRAAHAADGPPTPLRLAWSGAAI